MNESIVPLSDAERITITLINGEGRPELRDQLLPYCDYLRVNPGLPGCSPLAGSHKFSGYHLTMDGNLRYPANYVPRMVQAVERYGRRAIIGVGGWLVMDPQGLHEFRQGDAITRDTPVHILDTRTIAYHIDTVPVRECETALNMCVACWAQQQHVPMVSLRRPSMWLWQRMDPVRSPSRPVDRQEGIRMLTLVPHWNLYKARTRNAKHKSPVNG